MNCAAAALILPLRVVPRMTGTDSGRMARCLQFTFRSLSPTRTLSDDLSPGFLPGPGEIVGPENMAVEAEPQAFVDGIRDRIDNLSQFPAGNVDGPQADVVLTIHPGEQDCPAIVRPEWTFIAISRIGRQRTLMPSIYIH